MHNNTENNVIIINSMKIFSLNSVPCESVLVSHSEETLFWEREGVTTNIINCTKDVVHAITIHDNNTAVVI